jgi:hypothetical protein
MLRFFSATSLMKKRNLFHSCQKPSSLLKKSIKVELGHITVRTGDGSRTIMCCGKMLQTVERTVMSKQCLPFIVGMLVRLPAR